MYFVLCELALEGVQSGCGMAAKTLQEGGAVGGEDGVEVAGGEAQAFYDYQEDSLKCSTLLRIFSQQPWSPVLDELVGLREEKRFIVDLWQRQLPNKELFHFYLQEKDSFSQCVIPSHTVCPLERWHCNLLGMGRDVLVGYGCVDIVDSSLASTLVLTTYKMKALHDLFNASSKLELSIALIHNCCIIMISAQHAVSLTVTCRMISILSSHTWKPLQSLDKSVLVVGGVV